MNTLNYTITLIEKVFNVRIIYSLFISLLSADTYFRITAKKSLFEIEQVEWSYGLVFEVVYASLIILFAISVGLPVIRLILSFAYYALRKKKLPNPRFYKLEELLVQSLKAKNELLYKEYLRQVEITSGTLFVTNMLFSIGVILIFRSVYFCEISLELLAGIVLFILTLPIKFNQEELSNINREDFPFNSDL